MDIIARDYICIIPEKYIFTVAFFYIYIVLSVSPGAAGKNYTVMCFTVELCIYFYALYQEQ